MHAVYTVNNGSIAFPSFGQGASPLYGALAVTSRSGSAVAQVGVLSSPPDGTLHPDATITDPTNVDELAVFASVLPAESGFIFDGFQLTELGYVWIASEGEATVDVSFVPNRVPVDLGRPGGLL